MGAPNRGPLAAQLPRYAAPLFQPIRYKVLYGGRGAARSWSVARALLIKAAQAPLRIGCFREIQKSIKDSVHRLLTDQIDLMGIPGYEITDHELRHANGSLFLFDGLRSNVTKIKSLEGIDIAWVEEAERVSKNSWDVLIPTIRKTGSEIWVTFNPDLEDDPTFVRFVKQPPPNAWVKKVGGDDNPWFPDTLAQERAYAYAVDPDAAEHVWGGACRKSTKAQILSGKWIVEEFEPMTPERLVAEYAPGRAPNADHVLDDEKLRALLWDGPYHGADFGFAQDPNTLVRCWIAPGTIPKSTGRLMIEYEAYKIGQDTDAIPDAWKAAVPGCERYTIRADSARPETISYLQRYGFPSIVGVDKWNGSVEDGIAYLRQFEKIVIHPRCVHAKDEAQHYSYKTDPRTGDVLPDIVDKHNHCLAGDTLVDTLDGQFTIADLVGRIGTAFTLDGPRRFHSVRQTSQNEALYRVQMTDGRSFVCTADHPVLTADGWQPALALSTNMSIMTVDAKRYTVTELCRRNTSNSTDVGTVETTQPGTTGPITDGTVARSEHRRISIGTCGSSTTDQSQPATRFTIPTRTSTPRTPRGWCACPKRRTTGSPVSSTPPSSAPGCGATSSSGPSRRQPSGTEAERVISGTATTPAEEWRRGYTEAPASIAARISSGAHLSERESFARMLVSRRGDGRPVSMTFDGNVLVVGAPSPSTAIARPRAAPGNAQSPCATVADVRFVGYGAVYNMEVDGAHHFTVEGGLVVHNCIDALRYALSPLIRSSDTGIIEYYAQQVAQMQARREQRS